MATTLGSMPTLMNPFESPTGFGLTVDDLFGFGLPGYLPDYMWDFEDESNSRPATFSQLPNEADFDPTITDGGHPSFIPAAYGENGVYPNSEGMEALEDFNNFVSAPGQETAQMGGMGFGFVHLSSTRTFSGTGIRGRSRPRRRSLSPLSAASHFNVGCDPCLGRGLRCSLLDEELMPCSRCRQLRENCIVIRPDSSEERTPYRTNTPVVNPEPSFQGEAHSDIFPP
jgi:hypothetical protein